MAPSPPLARCSEAAAAAALEHLRRVEKQLQNDGLAFDKGTVRHLEDAISAIRELEEERTHILELLEEETIKNCNLRVRIKGIPEIVMKEFEALVAAARRSRLGKIEEMEASAGEMVSALEQTCFKQGLSEQQNLLLREEQKEFGGKHEAAVELLNRQMAAKHSVCIRINEVLNVQKEEEGEIAWHMNAIRELEEQMAREVSAFEEQQKLLQGQTAELQRQLQARRLQAGQKRVHYEAQLAILQAVREQVEEKNQAVVSGREELAKLSEMVKNLKQEYKDKKAEKEKILRETAELQNNMASLDLYYRDAKQVVLQQLVESEAEMETATQAQKKLRAENSALRAQYEAMVEEERRFRSRRDRLVREFERLSNEVAEKLDRPRKLFMEMQHIEEEQEHMQDVLEMAESSYRIELESLKTTLLSEGDKSKTLEREMNSVSKHTKKVESRHVEFMKRAHNRMESGQESLLNLTRQHETLEKDMLRSEAYIKILSDKYSKKATQVEKFNKSITAELGKLEGEYKANLKLLQEKEEKLSIDLPFAEKQQMKLKETNTAYDGQKAICSELNEKETTLSKSISYSLQKTDRLRRLKTNLRDEIKNGRETANQQLCTFFESLKFLERDNYEVNRKLCIVNTENARFREAIAHLRAEIFTMESEEETCRLKRQQAQEETRSLHDLFDNRWSRDKNLWQLFLLEELKVLKDLKEQIERFKKRNKKIDFVSNGLQLNHEGIASLIESQPSTEDDSPVTFPITA